MHSCKMVGLLVMWAVRLALVLEEMSYSSFDKMLCRRKGMLSIERIFLLPP